MTFPSMKQVVAVVTLLLCAASLSACGCGPLGLNYCGGGYGGHGGGHGGYGGGHGGYFGGGGGPGR